MMRMVHSRNTTQGSELDKANRAALLHTRNAFLSCTEKIALSMSSSVRRGGGGRGHAPLVEKTSMVKNAWRSY